MKIVVVEDTETYVEYYKSALKEFDKEIFGPLDRSCSQLESLGLVKRALEFIQENLGSIGYIFLDFSLGNEVYTTEIVKYLISRGYTNFGVFSSDSELVKQELLIEGVASEGLRIDDKLSKEFELLLGELKQGNGDIEGKN